MAIRLDHGSDELTELHEINVVPFIDVMLVLLIIFMVAAPLATVDIPVNLPSSRGPAAAAAARNRSTSRSRPTAALTIGDSPITARCACRARSTRRPDRRQRRNAVSARRPNRAVWRASCGCIDTICANAGYHKFSLLGLEGNREWPVMARALPWFEDEDPRDLRRWVMAAFIVRRHPPRRDRSLRLRASARRYRRRRTGDHDRYRAGRKRGRAASRG